MRYPTREYQSDSSSLPLGRSADWSPTACTPGWLDKPGVHLECYRTKNTNELLDTGLSISVLRWFLRAIDHQDIHWTPGTFQPEPELFLEGRKHGGRTTVADAREIAGPLNLEIEQPVEAGFVSHRLTQLFLQEWHQDRQRHPPRRHSKSAADRSLAHVALPFFRVGLDLCAVLAHRQRVGGHDAGFGTQP